ncbi:MAG: nucleotidyltransferase domain-containing protein [Myxococcales bacterium]|nr:nucleotidyltransferase domain-containing protein [Myxococcales bacterium]
MQPVTPEQTARTLLRRVEEKLRRHQSAMEHAKQAIAREVPAIAARHGARRVYLFGSLAWGDTHDGSDIDLAVEGAPDEQRSALAAELMLALPLPVDVLDLGELSEAFRRRIVDHGLLVYEAKG